MYMSQNAEMLSKLIHLTMKLLKAVLTDSISQTLDNPSLFTQKKTAHVAPPHKKHSLRNNSSLCPVK